jgi:hypothetical protein
MTAEDGMTATFQRRAPVDLPGPEGDNSIAREPLWHAFGAGVDNPEPPPWTFTEEPAPEAHVVPPPPASVRDGDAAVLPLGTVDLLARARYPDGRITDVPAEGDRLWYALIASFGVHRREPDNPFNDHRGYASPRCLFPVAVFAGDEGRWRMLDVERHSTVALAGARRPAGPPSIVLVGRYTAIPRAYKWFRGSLVNLELGIALRALAVGLGLFGLPGWLRLPNGRSVDLVTELGLHPTGEWSLPLTVGIGDDRPGDRTDGAVVPGERLTAADTAPPADASLADLVRVNRAQDFAGSAVPLGRGVPERATVPPGGLSWAELLWRRNSGRMPRGLHGMAGRRRRVPADALIDALRWLAVPPPGDALGAALAAVTATVVVQDVDGHRDGVYRVQGADAVLVAEDSTAAARLEGVYGYPLTPGNGCAVRHASMIWMLSVRPRELSARFGDGGWTAAQYACGWATHGLCLAAASAGLFARPVRAFREIPTQRILGLEPDDMIVLAVVVGTPRPSGGTLLDLRL